MILPDSQAEPSPSLPPHCHIQGSSERSLLANKRQGGSEELAWGQHMKTGLEETNLGKEQWALENESYALLTKNGVREITQDSFKPLGLTQDWLRKRVTLRVQKRAEGWERKEEGELCDLLDQVWLEMTRQTVSFKTQIVGFYLLQGLCQM